MSMCADVPLELEADVKFLVDVSRRVKVEVTLSQGAAFVFLRLLMRLFFAGFLNHIVVMPVSSSCTDLCTFVCEFWECSQCSLNGFRRAAIFCDSISWCFLE